MIAFKQTGIMNTQDLSPLILLASCMSFGMMVTLLAWMAQRLVSSKRPTRYASAASWRAMMAVDWKEEREEGKRWKERAQAGPRVRM